MNELNKNIVKKILLMPIKCYNHNDGIYIKDNIIYSGQKYYSTLDEDMCDFAVGYYNIVYKKDILDKTLLSDKQFAGDTMNSFESIANLVVNAGKSKKDRTEYNTWPIYLQNYYTQYHCLANFWLLPMEIGRKNTKMNRYDSPYLFIKLLSENKYIFSNYKDYEMFFCENSNTNNYISAFIKNHYLSDTLCDLIIQHYNQEDAEQLIKLILQDIKKRANIIANIKGNDLLEYFLKLNIIQ